MAEKVPASQYEGDGVVVATTRLGNGPAPMRDNMGQPADCTGAAMGVMVTSAGGQSNWIYDENGEPCNDATLLFDGKSPLGARPADPAVKMDFVDSLGALPSAPNLPPVPRIVVTSDALDRSVAQKGKPVGAPEAAGGKDTLASTIRTWQTGMSEADARAASDQNIAATEATLAAVRNLDRATSGTVATQDKVTQMAALLRQKERELDEAKRRASAAQGNSLQQRALAEASLSKAQQSEQNLRAELSAAKDRLAATESQNQQLAVSKAQQQKTYEERITTLNGDLKASEKQAAASRNELVMQAAAKIAEAEQLANAARLAEADSKAREAARLKGEAETMLQRALDLQNSKAVIAPDLAKVAPDAAPMALMDVPVVVHATDQTLPNLVASILKQAKAQAGEWKSDFQLTKANSYILAEKWSLTAEAPVSAVFKNLADQIKAAHKVTLTFTQFPQSRLVVVTDN